MADNTPAWIKETFTTFRPGPISTNGISSTWLSVQTNTPGEHRFTDAYPVKPGPGPSYGDGMYVLIDGPGIVTFRLKHFVKSLSFSVWSPNGNVGTVHARYFGPDGSTYKEIDHPIVQTGEFALFVAPTKEIAGVDISRNASSAQHVCIDNFGTFDEEKLPSLEALKKASLTIDDIRHSLR